MGNVEQLLELIQQINWWFVLFFVCLSLVVIKFVWELGDWLLFNKLGIETRKMREKRKDKQQLDANTNGLNKLEKKHEEDKLEIKECVAAFMEEVRKQEKSNREHWEESMQVNKELSNTVKEVMEGNQKRDAQINSLITASKEQLAEKINEKYKYYISINGIPEDEYDEFVSMHKAYNGVGGNHHGDAKFEYCIEHLKVIPVETKLTIKHKE